AAARATLDAAKELNFTPNEQSIVDCSWKAIGLLSGTCATLVEEAAAPSETSADDSAPTPKPSSKTKQDSTRPNPAPVLSGGCANAPGPRPGSAVSTLFAGALFAIGLGRAQRRKSCRRK